MKRILILLAVLFALCPAALFSDHILLHTGATTRSERGITLSAASFELLLPVALAPDWSLTLEAGGIAWQLERTGQSALSSLTLANPLLGISHRPKQSGSALSLSYAATLGIPLITNPGPIDENRSRESAALAGTVISGWRNVPAWLPNTIPCTFEISAYLRLTPQMAIKGSLHPALAVSLNSRPTRVLFTSWIDLTITGAGLCGVIGLTRHWSGTALENNDPDQHVLVLEIALDQPARPALGFRLGLDGPSGVASIGSTPSWGLGFSLRL